MGERPTGKHLQRRRLSCAIHAEETKALSRGDAEGERLDRFLVYSTPALIAHAVHLAQFVQSDGVLMRGCHRGRNRYVCVVAAAAVFAACARDEQGGDVLGNTARLPSHVVVAAVASAARHDEGDVRRAATDRVDAGASRVLLVSLSGALRLSGGSLKPRKKS